VPGQDYLSPDIHVPNAGEAAEALKGSAKKVASIGVKGVDELHEGVHHPHEKAEQSKKDMRRAGKEAIDHAGRVVKEAAKATPGKLNETAHKAVHKAKAVLIENQWYPANYREIFRWMPGYTERHTSTWDFFKQLVDNWRRFWWTQQWMTGYSVWAVYVAIECKFLSSPLRIEMP
jgi:hypothetical protein